MWVLFKRVEVRGLLRLNSVPFLRNHRVPFPDTSRTEREKVLGSHDRWKDTSTSLRSSLFLVLGVSRNSRVSVLRRLSPVETPRTTRCSKNGHRTLFLHILSLLPSGTPRRDGTSSPVGPLPTSTGFQKGLECVCTGVERGGTSTEVKCIND